MEGKRENCHYMQITMILYIENHKDSTQKLLELINEFSKVAGYKINIQKSVALLYTNNDISERVSKKPIHFIITSKTKNNKKPRNKPDQEGEKLIH